MKSLFNLIWLADNILPLKEDNFLLTSRGKVTSDDKKNKCFVLDGRDRANETYLYDSNYDVYEANMRYNNILKNIDIFEISNIGYKNIVEDNNDYIEFVVDKDELYVFDLSDNYLKLISFLIDKYKINYVYSKKKIFDNYEIIRFSFLHHLLKNNDFLIDEGFKTGLVGDYVNSTNFSMGVFKHNNQSKMPLLFWPRDNKEYKNYLSETNYYEFKKEISCIKEFEFDNNELELVKTNHGKFYFLKENNEIIGFVNFDKIFNTFIYVECLAVKKEYRKQGYSDKIIESIKCLANQEKKNLILTIEVSKLINFYLKNGFKEIGTFKFE